MAIGVPGVSPAFTVSAEEVLVDYLSVVTRISIDGVEPPTLGADAGATDAFDADVNEWTPWIDEKVVLPKYDGVCQYLAMASNRPTYAKDYQWIALMRAVDRMLAPRYSAFIAADVDSVVPSPPPIPR